jgi:Protein of unknown function (DUF3987)
MTPEYVQLCEHGEPSFGCPTCWPVEPELMAAFRGPAGDFVRSFVLHSEAHPVALLGTYLTLAGNRMGPRAHMRVGATRHPGRLFFITVGETSVARKGQSWSDAGSVFEAASPGWREDFVYGGFGSGEGLIARVAERMDAGARDQGTVRDPRLVVYESEFGSVLRVANRDGSILSGIMRDAWDGTPLQNNIRRERLKAPAGHMVSIVGHITVDELRRELTRTDIANGLGNRLLFAIVRRTRKIAHPRSVDPNALAADLDAVTKRAAGVERMRFTEAGADAWTLVYDVLEDEAERAGGLVGPLLARGSAQTLRLAVIYALLDASDSIHAEHVEAAVALWRYCSRSVRAIFGGSTGNPLADRIAEGVDHAGPSGLTRTQVSELLGRNHSKTEIDVAVDELTRTGRYRTSERETAGRTATVLVRNETHESGRRKRGLRSSHSSSSLPTSGGGIA